MKKFFLLPILSLIYLVGCQSHQISLTEKQWRKIAQENSELSANDLHPQAQITALSKDKIWIDFNHEELCGIRHCLYAIYQINPDTESANLQWRSYLDPKLPPDVPLMEKSKKACIFIHQSQEQQVKKYELCPKNGQYKLTRKVSNRG
ncbi:MAG: hypothetical protein WBM32_18415 [Crocosphaera sp.]|jgi:uncharacterized protein YcfL